MEFVGRVYDGVVGEFTSDSTVEGEGWLVCLREKRKIPKLHQVGCSDIGDDIWSAFVGVSDKHTFVSVECDMDKCSKAAVTPVTKDSALFYRTTNICDAGWQITRSNKFDLQFSGPDTLTDKFFTEPYFEVLSV